MHLQQNHTLDKESTIHRKLIEVMVSDQSVLQHFRTNGYHSLTPHFYK